MKIDPTKKYKTRDGREARILSTESPDPEYPVVGATLDEEGWVNNSWTAEGKYSSLIVGATHDLIEVREPVLVKLVVATSANGLYPPGDVDWTASCDLTEGRQTGVNEKYWRVVTVEIPQEGGGA